MKEYFFASTMLASLATLTPACGPSDAPATDDSAIVGGGAVSIHDNPWQVSLRTGSGQHFCGGSIIAPDWVLTAAHCIQGTSVSSLRVLAGVSRLDQASSGQTRSAAQIIPYPGYTRADRGKDAALVRLTQPFDLSAAGVATIPFATPGDAAAGLMDPGLDSLVTGWGTTRENSSSISNLLLGVTVPIVSNADATEAYGEGKITEDQLAAGVMGVGGKDSCQGDSGGPLTVTNADGSRLLAGIVSWGYGCGDPSYPGMYGRVSSFAPWIQGYIQTNTPPTVQFTSPPDGSAVSGHVRVTAEASDIDGSVMEVRYTFPNGSVVSVDSAPYEAVWDSTTAADGEVVITAQAIDNGGAASTVASKRLVVSNGTDSCPAGTYLASDTPLAIPDNNATGVRSVIQVPGAGTVTSARVSLSIAHTYRGDLRVVLVSPAGTQLVLHDRAGGSADDVVLNGHAIAAFNDESALGEWRLQVSDHAALDVGVVESWSIELTLACASSNWRAESAPRVPTVDNGSVCDSVTVSGGGDAADVKLDLSGTHSFRSILRGTLFHNGKTVAAFPIRTFPRGYGVFELTDRTIAGFTGSADGVWTLCIVDTDGYRDRGVLNTWAVHN